MTLELEYIPGRFVVRQVVRPHPRQICPANHLSGSTWPATSARPSRRHRCRAAPSSAAAPVPAFSYMC
nr:hypothetical protein [Puniceibacterium confluentis]